MDDAIPSEVLAAESKETAIESSEAALPAPNTLNKLINGELYSDHD